MIVLCKSLGTNYQGQWDGWYGPSGRPDNETLPYDVMKVINSLAGKAAASVGRPVNPDKVSLKRIIFIRYLFNSFDSKTFNTNMHFLICLSIFTATNKSVVFINETIILCHGSWDISNFHNKNYLSYKKRVKL